MNPGLREHVARLLRGNRIEGRKGAHLEALWTLAEGGRCHYYDDGAVVLSVQIPASDSDINAYMRYVQDDVLDYLVEYVENELVPCLLDGPTGEKLYSRLHSLGWIEGTWLEPQRDRDPCSW